MDPAGPLEAIQPLLLAHQHLQATHQPALRNDKYLRFPRSHTTDRTTIYEIVSWSDPIITVYEWARERPEEPQTYLRADYTTTLMYDDLFTTETLHTRITMLHNPNSITGKCCLPQNQADPLMLLPTQ